MIYRTLQTALLFYEFLQKKLEEFRFEVNTYNVCVAKKMVNESHMTVVWYVDNVKASYNDIQELNVLVNYLKKIYENPEIGFMKITHRKVHKYLGIILDYMEDRKVKINMRKYIIEMIKDFDVILKEMTWWLH